MLSDLGRNVRSLLWALVLGLSVWIAAVTDADPDEVRALPAPVALEVVGQDPGTGRSGRRAGVSAADNPRTAIGMGSTKRGS